MPNPFKPSPLAYETTAVIDRGQFSEPLGERTLAGDRRMDHRNPLFKTQAEQTASMGSGAYFMANRNPNCRDSISDYEVLPGGQTVYFNGAQRRLVPYTPDSIPAGWTANRVSPVDLLDLRRSATDPPRTAPVLEFPDDRTFSGHGAQVSTKLRGRHVTNGSY